MLAGAIERLGREALVFAVLRALTLVGGVAALFVVPLRAEHELHFLPLLAGFVIYKAALLALLLKWAERSREIFFATLAADLAVVFLLVWFTGGGESHFYLLFYPLVALNAYYFGPGVGVLAAAVASGLLAAANWLVVPAAAWSHVASRAAILGLLALALGHVAVRERQGRAAQPGDGSRDDASGPGRAARGGGAPVGEDGARSAEPARRDQPQRGHARRHRPGLSRTGDERGARSPPRHPRRDPRPRRADR